MEDGAKSEDLGVVQKGDAAFCTVMDVFQNVFSCSAPVILTRGQLRQSDECDYDRNPTRLYKAIENLNWTGVFDFIQEGTWQDSGFEMLFSKTDVSAPERQACTWVTKFAENGSVEWSRIPLHAAMIHGAPYSVVKKLVDVYPEGIRCTDDKGMLPLHLAIKHSAIAKVLRLLLEKFPEAMFAKDNDGTCPFQMTEDERSKILSLVTSYTTKKIQEECGRVEKKKVQVLQQELARLKDVNDVLEAKLMSKSQLVDQSMKEKEQLLGQIAMLKNFPESAMLLDGYSIHGSSRITGRHHHRRETPQIQDETSDSSAINRLDKELRAEKQRLDEKNRLNRELRNEKEKLEEELRRSKQQVRNLTKQRMTDDLKYCQQRIGELDHHAALHKRMEEEEHRQDTTGYQEREDVVDFREEDDLERRIRQSQETVSRLLQRTTRRREPQSRSSREFPRRKENFGHARESDEVSEMTTPSFGGRSTEEVRSDLHKLMKTSLKFKESGIRDKISRMRQYHV